MHSKGAPPLEHHGGHGHGHCHGHCHCHCHCQDKAARASL